MSNMMQYIAILLLMLVLLGIYSTIQVANIKRLLRKIAERPASLGFSEAKKGPVQEARM